MIVIDNDSVCAVILNSYQQKARVYNVTLIFQSGNEYCNFHLLMHLLSMNNIIFGKKKKKTPHHLQSVWAQFCEVHILNKRLGMLSTLA